MVKPWFPLYNCVMAWEHANLIVSVHNFNITDKTVNKQLIWYIGNCKYFVIEILTCV